MVPDRVQVGLFVAHGGGGTAGAEAELAGEFVGLGEGGLDEEDGEDEKEKGGEEA